MNSIYLIIVGLVLVYISGTDLATQNDRLSSVFDIISGKTQAPGYSNIPLGRFLIGAFGVTLPLLTMSDRPDWQRSYILLILVGFGIVNYRGLEHFASWIGQAARK